jgi:hypothetical protein
MEKLNKTSCKMQIFHNQKLMKAILIFLEIIHRLIAHIQKEILKIQVQDQDIMSQINPMSSQKFKMF